MHEIVYQIQKESLGSFKTHSNLLTKSSNYLIFYNLLGRKKHGEKHKHKHGGGMLMMSGVAMVAMMTQFVLGKIAFVAGAALVIAKLALYFSTMVIVAIYHKYV